MRLSIVVAAVLLLAGCQAAQIAQETAACGALAKECIQLYSGGKAIKSIKDPYGLQPIPGVGVTFQDATGKQYLWSGDYLVRRKAQ